MYREKIIFRGPKYTHINNVTCITCGTAVIGKPVWNLKQELTLNIGAYLFHRKLL